MGIETDEDVGVSLPPQLPTGGTVVSSLTNHVTKSPTQPKSGGMKKTDFDDGDNYNDDGNDDDSLKETKGKKGGNKRKK
jgi:hypothetical protein